MFRHRHVDISDSETDYSETDVSIIEAPTRRTAFRRRSVSRHRRTPEDFSSTTFLSPAVQDVRIQRSSSTGGRRPHQQRRGRERVVSEAPPPPPATMPPQVFVDIKNDSRNRSSNKSRRQERKSTTNLMHEEQESEDETLLRSHHRRPRASTSVSRDASPRFRDFDLVIDQRILEKNDARQDLELQKQQNEIERLERELARRRESQDTRLLREEEIWYEDEISDRLRRLERFEKKQRMDEERNNAEYRHRLKRFEDAQRRAVEKDRVDEERRNADYQDRIKKFEEAERLAAEKEEVKAKLREEKLKAIQRKIDEDEERDRIKKEIRDEEARKYLAEQERMKQEAKMKADAVEEWKLNEERRIIAHRKAKEEKDAEFRKRLREEFGYTEEEIEEILRKKNNPEKKKDKGKKDKDKDDKKKDDEEKQATWIKVHRKHLLPDTLIAYRLAWDWDELDGNYIIIKQWVSEEFQEELFAHTRRLRDGKLVTETSSSLTELKVNDKRKDKMFLVRKKSPNRRAWIFT